VAPQVAGTGLQFAPQLNEPVRLSRLSLERLGDDALISGYVHEPS
jgi:hypothetical protein